MILEVSGFKKHYAIKNFLKPTLSLRAVDGVSFSLERGKTLAVVGESGCGKSTLAKLLLQIEKPTDGTFKIGGRDALAIPGAEFRKSIQMIFQDPYSSLNPRKRAWQIISEPLKINQGMKDADCRKRAVELMVQVGLRPELADRYPHMFSGGQRQRIGIARALALQPQVLICDEPISALDVSIQAQVINLLIDLQDKHQLSYVFISHDLSVVRHLSDEILVMYLGKVVEHGKREQIFKNARHPYTQALLASTPDLKRGKDKERRKIQGEPPSPLNPPPGCPFHKRCPFATEKCSVDVPALRQVEGRSVACHYAETTSV